MAVVDFIKWTSTFGEDAIKQMETPLTGVRLTASMLPLFGVAVDDAHTMLVMHENEAPWLAHLPVQMALTGFSDGLILVTEQFTIFDTVFPTIGIEVFVPYEHREHFEKARLVGFCHATARGLTIVNRTVPVFTPQRYEAERRAVKTGNQTTSLFSGV